MLSFRRITSSPALRLLAAPVLLVLPFLYGCPPQQPGGGTPTPTLPAQPTGAVSATPTRAAGLTPTATQVGTATPVSTATPTPPAVSANAGPDRTVEDLELVTLAGQGTDSAGGTVSYTWTQTAGPGVALAGQDTPTASFTAPNQSAELRFSLFVQSPNGQASDEVVVTVAAAPFLFVANRAGPSVARFRAGKSFDGDVEPAALLIGANTRLNGPSSLLIDKIGGLIVSNVDGNRIAGFLGALTITGNITPERYVGGPASLLNGPEGIAYDAQGDLLYVANFDAMPGRVNVYNNVTTPSFGGDVPPFHQIRSLGIVNPRDVELASTGELYVINAGGQNVTVYSQAASIDAEVLPSRTITSSEFINGGLLDGFIDAQGRLFIVASAGNRVLIFNDAASLGENAVPAGILTVPGAETLTGVVVDARGVGYLTDSSGNINAIYVYADLAGRNGAVAPNRTVKGGKTQLLSPWHMHLVNR